MAAPPRPVVMDPLHITEFASERYFAKYNQQQQQQQDHNGQSSAGGPSTVPAPAAVFSTPQLQSPFILPLRDTKSPPEQQEEKELPTEQKQKKSRFHIRHLLHTKSQPITQPSTPVPQSLSPPAVVEPQSVVADGHSHNLSKISRTLDSLFLGLPTELHVQIISSMPLADILQLRLASKAWHAMVTANESPIVRYHLQHNIPAYAKRLYPPDYSNLNFRYLCGLWHRLHVAAKLSFFICEWVTKEIFLRTTEAQKLEFAPQRERMRRRLIPLLFTIFHFFETYRARHLQYIIDHDGRGLQQTPYTINPIEAEVMSMYDDRTLLQVHQVFPLVVASFCRRLRPPSYVGRVEKSLRGYLKDKPADEVHVATLCIGGLRQVERFWEIKGYNTRRGAVDAWYNSVSRDTTETPAKPRRGLMGLGRKKSSMAIRDDEFSSTTAAAKTSSDGLNPAEQVMDDAVWERCNNLVFNTSLADGMPMGPLSRDQLHLLLPDLPVLQQLWLVTAEALILERKIVDRPSDIRRNAQVMLELIREDGIAEEDAWWYGQGSNDSVRPPLDSIEEDIAEDIPL